ncbi:HAD-IIB family hydrolase [Rhodobacteraceae bacterium M385]|nr:HAD-IIB family hydrolase [Rhodobacteraceae bacterium M385]
MAAEIPLLVFTDLDGTLIDHDTYQWDAATPALQALGSISAGIVLASSKTSAEIAPLRAALGLEDWPAIVENGAGMLPAHVRHIQGTSQHAKVRQTLSTLPAQIRRLFRGFGDVSAAEVAQMTGLTVPAAELAKQRHFSEPGQWLGSEVQKTEFVDALLDLGVQAQQGGRFLTLSFGGNKVDQMRRVIADCRPTHTIALGDAPNDVQMLEHADFGVIVRNPHRPPLPKLKGEDTGRIVRTDSPGPLGWNAAILSLLHRLDLH